MAEHFGNTTFMRYQAHCFEQYPISNAYEKEEEEILKTVKVVPTSELPLNSNIVNSYVVCQVKHTDVRF